MRSIIPFFILLVFSFSLAAAETAPASKKPSKPSAKTEAVAQTLTPQQRDQLLTLLNEGDEAALMAIPGIGAVRAKAIQKARPMTDVIQAINVDGIGEGTFAQMVAYAKAGFQQPEKKAGSSKRKSVPKKPDATEPK